ncbi:MULTISPECIES: hypothetical protein [unclassified Bacillus (in: firmicutes)]
MRKLSRRMKRERSALDFA